MFPAPSKNSIYSNAAGNLVPQATYEKAMADRYASTRVGNDTLGNPVYGYTGTVTNPSGINQSRAGIRATQPTNTGGGLSFSFGGGGGGDSAPIPNNLLTPRTFPSYTSTYTPPTPATPDPYNWATRDPYIYGEGLSNAGAAYDIWGSAPGTNPYLLSTPQSHTQGLLGMQPVQLPANVPSTNVGANINTGGTSGGGANDGWTGGNVKGHTAYATADDAIAAGDYWSAYRKDHQQWRDGQGIWAGKGKQPGQSDLHYPGNPALGIRSDANQLQAMGMGDKITPDIAPATSVKISPSVSLTPPSVNTTTTDVPVKATKPWTPPVASPKPVVTVTPPPAKTTTTDVPIKATKPFTLTSKPTVTASKPTVTFSEKKVETKKAVSAYNAGGGMNIPAPAPAPSSRGGTAKNYGVTGRRVTGGR